MSYNLAGIDVHKKVLTVVVADVETGGEYKFERCRFGTNPSELYALAEWMVQQQVEEVVMESTALYWRPVWQALERYWQPQREQREGAGELAGSLHLAQAESNRARRGRKDDWLDAERLVKRLVAQELILSYVPDADQRVWRTLCRRKYQLTQERVRLRNHLEGFLEEAQIKLTSLVSDLFGVSARRMLQALADGETSATALAALADIRLRATPEQLRDALGACAQLDSAYRKLLKMALQELKLMEKHIAELDKQVGRLLKPHQQAVQRLAEVPGLGADSAQQIIAQIGPEAASFPSAKDLSSWVGICPGQNISAETAHGSRSPKGNCTMRRVLNQAANAAVRCQGSIFEFVYRRMLPRTGHGIAICAIAHRLCKLIWKILHAGVQYEERGPALSAKSQKRRTARMIKSLQALGYQVVLPTPEPEGAR
jgi:transposase